MSGIDTITREEMIEQSVEDYLRNGLFAVRDLPDHQVLLQDAFEYSRFNDAPLDKEYITFGFNFDDGGKPGEMGSNLTVKVHTLEVWVFATTPQRGRNLKNLAANTIEELGLIPLLDFNDPAKPEIDQLVVLSVLGQRQPHPNPEPWQENAFTVTIKIEDTYYAG